MAANQSLPPGFGENIDQCMFQNGTPAPIWVGRTLSGSEARLLAQSRKLPKHLIRERFLFVSRRFRGAFLCGNPLAAFSNRRSFAFVRRERQHFDANSGQSSKRGQRKKGELMKAALAIDASFAKRFCLPDLMAAQNPDAGWGFRAGQSSAAEPTSWALLAISGLSAEPSLSHKKSTGVRFLRQAQLSDGSWAAVEKDEAGGWVTSLACIALRAIEGSTPESDAGLNWLCRSWPGEGGLWWRLRHRLFGRPQLVGQDHRLRGWSWTPGTSSWVEPTAYALLALRGARGTSSFLASVDRRCNLAQAMLCNRMCTGGGWNCGNPFVYGTAGSSLIGPTCWAMLALGEFANRTEVRRCVVESLDWLERTYLQSQGPGSLALAHLCLKAFGRNPSPIDLRLSQMYDENGFLGQIPVLAWALLATQPIPRWLRPASLGSN